MKKIKYLTILAVSAFIFNACTKQVAGPTGPVGPTGPQGITSPYNYTIDSVAPGTTANKGGWGGTTNAYSFTIGYVPSLTTPSNSIVEVYVATSNKPTTTWYDLSAANVISTGDYMSFSYATYVVNIYYNYVSPPTQMVYFKVVVISNP